MTPEQLSSVMQTARERCSSSGARFTEKRQRLLETIVSSDAPLSAYELAERYKIMHGSDLPAMSVYRILEFLEQEHLVHRLNLNNKYIACSHIRCCKTHGVSQFMICSVCDKVKEAILPPELLAMLDKRVKEAGFSLAGPHVELSCVCDECKSDKEGSAEKHKGEHVHAPPIQQ